MFEDQLDGCSDEVWHTCRRQLVQKDEVHQVLRVEQQLQVQHHDEVGFVLGIHQEGHVYTYGIVEQHEIDKVDQEEAQNLRA